MGDVLDESIYTESSCYIIVGRAYKVIYKCASHISFVCLKQWQTKHGMLCMCVG